MSDMSRFWYVTQVVEEDFNIPAAEVDPRYYAYIEKEFENHVKNKSSAHLQIALHLIKHMLNYYYNLTVTWNCFVRRDKKILSSVAYKVLNCRYVILCERLWFFKADLKLAEVNSDWLCAICFDSHANGVVQFADCHTFHMECLVPWLSIHQSCPLCRQTYFKSTPN